MLGHYVRAHLHRRLFIWFGVTIFVTGAAVFLAARAVGGVNPTPWWKAQSFVTGRFAHVWNNPPERAELAHSLSEELDLSVSLSDTQGNRVEQHGPPCEHPWWTAPVREQGSGKLLGNVRICSAQSGKGPSGILLLFVALFVLWAATGKISRRLTRPLMELAFVAKSIGSGNLSARVQMSRHVHGEAQVVGIAMNEMAERIERQLRDQRELLAAVSHELRTPLARVRLLTELIREAGGASKTVDDLDQEIIEIDALVGDLLASSRIEFGTLSLHPLDAADVARRAIERAGRPVDSLLLEAQTTQFEGDATLLARALANLLENARKHGGEEIRLRVRNGDTTIVFEVEDNGGGFQPGEEEQLFRPFYRRANPAEDESGSLGLGLTLVRRIAEAHHGRAYAKNGPSGGAVVGMELPLRPAA